MRQSSFGGTLILSSINAICQSLFFGGLCCSLSISCILIPVRKDNRRIEQWKTEIFSTSTFWDGKRKKIFIVVNLDDSNQVACSSRRLQHRIHPFSHTNSFEKLFITKFRSINIVIIFHDSAVSPFPAYFHTVP